MQTFNSIYLGIVVQNNDPEYRGRIKVWVPHVSTTIYNKWNQLKSDASFSFPGSPEGEELSKILVDLKDTLPWAEMCSPIMGASTAKYYNAPSDLNHVSDGPISYAFQNTNFTNTSSDTQIDPEGKSNKPGALYENYPVGDAFGNTSKIDSANNTVDDSLNYPGQQRQNLNQYSNNYRPSTYSNAAKGLFSIPNVGAHVWVFFREGIPLYPVYMGTTFGQDEFKSIFKAGDDTYPDYPGTYENINSSSQKNPTIDSSTYRNKLVLNQRGAAIEIINTTDRESYKVTHFNGSYYEIKNQFTALFNTKNLQLLTLKDKFETIKGHNNLYVGRDSDNIVAGDHHLKIGIWNEQAVNKWSALYKQITGSNAQQLLNKFSNLFTNEEKKMGFGGNSFEYIAKHRLTTVGITYNTSETFNRLPGAGKTIITAVKPNLTGGGFVALPTILPSILELYVPDMPGGNYDIFAMNRYSVTAGAGGINLASNGKFSMQGTIVDVRAEAAINIGGKDSLIDVQGDVVTISGNSLQLKNNLGDQVIVDSTLGVTKNVIIGGGAYVEGELFVNHITAPLEYQVTENTQIQASGPVINPTGQPNTISSGWNITGADALGNLVIVIPSLPVIGSATEPTLISVPINPGTFFNLNTVGTGILTVAAPHSHAFKNIPLTLLDKPLIPGVPSQFSKTAANIIGTSEADKNGISSAEPANGRKQTATSQTKLVEDMDVGESGPPYNFPNGPGSDLTAPFYSIPSD